MTGYGKAESVTDGKRITVEVRSLNSKQLDLTVKLPPLYRPLEYEVRGEAARRLQRGKVDIYINCEKTSGADTVTINRAAFCDYLHQLHDICNDNGIDTDADAIVPAILRLPEVVQSEQLAVGEQERALVAKLVSKALDELDGFRIQEGRILMDDLKGRIKTINSLKDEILPYEKARTEAIKKRIRESIELLGVAVDDNRLEQEMIFYIEKLDITEEKVRLGNHCRYFLEVADREDNAGRKLGFIAQEVGREINTLGSKANDAAIQKAVIRMKDELEKIKEQLLNIL